MCIVDQEQKIEWYHVYMKFLAGVGVAFILAANVLPLTALAQTNPATSSGQATTSTAKPTCSMQVTPSSINIGDPVTLKWASTDATTGTITGVGTVAPKGQINLLPGSASQTTFVGTFTGPGGTGKCSATVTVSSGSGAGGSGGGDVVAPTQAQQTQPVNWSGSPLPQSVGSAPTSLVVCGTGNWFDPSTNGATGCQACNLAQVIQNIINFCIMLAIPIFAGLFAYAGVLYITSVTKAENISHAKEIFGNAFIGFVLVLSGWLIVNTLLHAIFNNTGNGWFTIQCTSQDSRPRFNNINQVISSLPIFGGGVAPGSTVSSGSGGGSNVPSDCSSGACNNDTASLIKSYNSSTGSNQLLSASNVSYNNVDSNLVTSVINDVAMANSGSITVTSAERPGSVTTSGSVSNHATGNALDIVTTPQFDTYMQQNFESVKNPIDANLPAYKDQSGYVWSLESASTPGSTGAHYHVSLTGR